MYYIYIHDIWIIIDLSENGGKLILNSWQSTIHKHIYTHYLHIFNPGNAGSTFLVYTLRLNTLSNFTMA